jgi:hypothetical protein
MHTTPPIRVDQLEDVLQTIQKNYKQLAIVYRTDWRTDADRAEAREALATTVQTAKQTVDRLQGTQDLTLQQLRGKLLLEVELSDQVLKHPELLR